MSDNYPPGVTGNEWQIVGSESLTVTRECAGTEARLYPAYLVDQLLKSKGHFPFDSLAGMSTETEYECSFSGSVAAEIYNYELLWTCPICGHEHAESWGGPEEFDEPDDDYDDFFGSNTDYY